VHEVTVEADAGAPPGQRGADLDNLVAERDDPGGVDQPVDLTHLLADSSGSREREIRS
jgi:hypothetical protein